MHLDQFNQLWIGTWGGGVSMFDPETQIFQNYTVKDGLPGNYVLAVTEGPHGNLWIGSNKGLSKFDGTTFLNYSQINGLISNYVFSIEFDNNGFLWVGGHHGMTRLKIDVKSGHLSRLDSK
jgi:ligand-binding sensor domain-containing protein